jgi:hypothetical protein
MKYTILHSVYEVPIPASAQNLGLSSGVFDLSDKEYQACSKGHIAAVTSRFCRKVWRRIKKCEFCSLPDTFGRQVS